MKTRFHLSLLPSLILVILAPSLHSQQRPAPPKNNVDSVELPAAAEPEAGLPDKASLSDRIRLGFAVDLGGKLLLQNWNITASIVGIEGQSIRFRTAEGEEGTLVYRVPQGTNLTFALGQTISVRRVVQLVDGKIGYELSLVVDGDLALIAARKHQQEPPRFASPPIFRNSLLNDDAPVKAPAFRMPEEGLRSVSKSKFVEVFEVPIDLTMPGQNFAIMENGAQIRPSQNPRDINLNNENFRFVLLESRYVVAQPESGEVIESPGYTLEYLFVKNTP